MCVCQKSRSSVSCHSPYFNILSLLSSSLSLLLGMPHVCRSEASFTFLWALGYHHPDTARAFIKQSKSCPRWLLLLYVLREGLHLSLEFLTIPSASYDPGWTGCSWLLLPSTGVSGTRHQAGLYMGAGDWNSAHFHTHSEPSPSPSFSFTF